MADQPPPQGGPEEGALPNKAAQVRAQTLEAQAPRAKEPLSPDVVGAFLDAIRNVANTVFDQKVPEIPAPPGPIEQVPPGVYQPVATIAHFIESMKAQIPPLADYAFDPQEACSSLKGMLDATRKMNGLAKDRAVAVAIRQAPQAGGPPRTPPGGAEGEGGGSPPSAPTHGGRPDATPGAPSRKPSGAADNFMDAMKRRKKESTDVDAGRSAGPPKPAPRPPAAY